MLTQTIHYTGFFIGPCYPVGLYILTKVIPQDLHVGAMGKYHLCK